MQNAVTIADAAHLPESEIFDLESAYVLALSTVVRDGSRQGYFHPSGCGACRRKQVYEYICAPFIPTTDPDSLEIFDMGHAVHEIIGRKLMDVGRVLNAKSIGYEMQAEVPFDPKTDKLYGDLRIGGTADVLIKIWAENWMQRSVVEGKSIKQENFDKLTKPKHEHLMQAHLYAYRFDTPIVYNWYYCKNNSKRKVYASAFNPEIFWEAVTYFEKLLDCAERGVLPEREEDFYICPRCEYRDECKPSVLTKIRAKDSSKTMASIRGRGRI